MNTEQLVGLIIQSPMRIGQAVSNNPVFISRQARVIHELQEEAIERKLIEAVRYRSRSKLGILSFDQSHTRPGNMWHTSSPEHSFAWKNSETYVT